MGSAVRKGMHFKLFGQGRPPWEEDIRVETCKEVKKGPWEIYGKNMSGNLKMCSNLEMGAHLLCSENEEVRQRSEWGQE